MNRLALLIAGAGVALFGATAAAGEVADAAAKAEALAGEGKHLQALDVMSEGLDLLWGQTPLTVRKAVFVQANPGGFGVYQGRDGSVFKPGEKLMIYAEPVGYAYRKDGDAYEVDLVADVALRSPRGTLGAQKNFATFGLKSLVKNREFYAFITYDFSGLEAGEYVAKTTLTDQVSGKKTSFDMPFTME